MEADWEVEIGPGAPVIDAEWSGFIDLRRTPGRIGEIAEVQQFPALAEVLLRLNGPHSDLDAITSTAVWGSSIWTSKCDFWTLEQCDPYEMDATFKESIVGFGCYIDVLSRDELVFAELNSIEEWARDQVSRLRKIACRCCRADLVIRRAFSSTGEGFGITAYISSCGEDTGTARAALDAALTVFANEVGTIASSALTP